MSDGRKDLRLRVPVPLHDRIELIAADLGCSINAWATQALAKQAKQHIPLAEFLDQGATRGTGRGKHEVGGRRLSHYSPADSHPGGWPLHVPDSFWTRKQIIGYNSDMSEVWEDINRRPADEVANLRAAVTKAAGTFGRDLLERARLACGLGPLTDAQWAETVAWAKSDE